MSNFIGIGVGPGDPELLTIKAVNSLKTLDILIVPKGKSGGDSEAFNIVSCYLEPKTQIMQRIFPMTSDLGMMDKAIDPIANEIEKYVNEGLTVGFVTLGDPMLYSTYIYLLKRLHKVIPVITLSGISSYSAIASGYNRPLVEGDMPLLIYPCIDDLTDLEDKLNNFDSIVLMKVYRSFDQIKELILKLQLQSNCLIVSDFGKSKAKYFENIETVSFEDISYFTTILINKRWSI